jgi:hypothetical protein
MIESSVQRLSSVHLEDMAFIALSAIPDDDGAMLHHQISDLSRTRLRSRLKQLSRYDWPSSMAEDGALRRGYTLRQCCRLATALLMLDAYLPPSLAVALARDNERSFLSAIATRLRDTARSFAEGDDPIAVVLPGEIRDATDPADWSCQETGRVRLIRYDDLTAAWSEAVAGPGTRLLVNPATSMAAVWRWIVDRRLMDDSARQAFLDEIDRYKDAPGFEPLPGRSTRR